MTKALVLGAGGPVGIGWESGLIAGLAEKGVEMSLADHIVGTSAGSYVGAQLAMGRSPAEIAAHDLSDSPPAPLIRGPVPDLSSLMGKVLDAAAGKRPAQEVRAEIGAFALQAATMAEEEFIARFAPSLGGRPDGAWPGKSFVCTAVDVSDGAFRVWNREAGIGLARAVASSCAVPGIFPPVTFGGTRYIDGGVKSGTNADLAKGYDTVIVVSAMSRTMPPFVREIFGRRFTKELDAVRESGGRVEVIEPDDGSAEAFGANMMDDRRRHPAAVAGLEQGRREAARLAEFWR